MDQSDLGLKNINPLIIYGVANSNKKMKGEATINET